MKHKFLGAAIIAALLLAGCNQTIPKSALQMKPDTLAMRQLQTRSFDTSNEAKLLSAGASVLQDLGFSIEESETKLGVILGEKDRDAVEAGQVAGKIFMAVMFGAHMAIDKNQKIRASLITRPVSSKKTNLRITIQRVIWNEHGQISRTESVTDQEIYQDFFNKLSKSVFLNANEI